MRFEEFRKTVEAYPLISWPLIKMLTGGDRKMTLQLSRWKHNGKLIRLNKNYFILNESDRKIHPSKLHLAGELYKPSYVSLEYALSFHGLIPERVIDLTCVTTKKTKTFINSVGTFRYRHLKNDCFTGFTEEKDEAGLHFNLAVPEKALVDFLYLNLRRFKFGKTQPDIKDFLMESYRLQNIDALQKRKLSAYSKLFKCKKLSFLISRIAA